MRVLRIAWLGIATSEYTSMLKLLRDGFGLAVEFDDDVTAELSTLNDDRVQVFGPGSRYFDFYRSKATGPVPLFEVNDVESAHMELQDAGMEFVGDLEADAAWRWFHFRAPDGNLYAVASRHS